MSASRTCPSCGAPVAGGALFCARCGQDVTLVDPAEAPTLVTPPAGAGRIRATMRQMLRDATLGEYEILDELGRGGMATVFLAHDIALDRKVAIKVIAPHLLEGEGMAERFKQEARTAAQLSHPHIIPIYAVKQTESTIFFVMKYVDGRPLDEIIERTGPLPTPMVRDVLAKVGAALGYAHRRSVIHRDVKPANIMIDGEGTPIVTDFGIAKVTESKSLTITGATIGTPSYMSPEQCEARPVTGASDQYSLGVVTWEMLTGEVPFRGDSAVTTMYKHCHEPLPPLLDFRPDCPPELVEIVTRMLAKDPAERWPSLEAAVRRLGSAADAHFEPIAGLLELVGEATPRDLMARLSTPGSSLPGVTPAGGPAGGAPPRRSRLPAAAAVALLAVAGASLTVLRPWREGSGLADPAAVAPAAVTAGAGPGGGGDAGDAAGTGSEPDATDAGAGGAATGGDPAAGTGGDAAAGGGAPAPSGGAGAQGPGAGAGAGAGAQSAGAQGPGGAADPAPPTPAPERPAAPPARVASVRIGGAPASLEAGQRAQLSAAALDAGGATLPGRAVRWSTSDARVGRVDAGGGFTAMAPGTVVVTAVVEGMSAEATLEVVAPAAASLVVAPASLSLEVGASAALAAEARSRAGEPIPGAPLAWESSNPRVATVSEAGVVTAAGAGDATVTATSGAASARVSVRVAAPAVPASAAVPELIAAYARALESGDILAVRQAYPGMTGEQQRQLATAIQDMVSAELRVESVDEQGDLATALVSGQYVFESNGRRSVTPVRFLATFQRTNGAWRLVRTE